MTSKLSPRSFLIASCLALPALIPSVAHATLTAFDSFDYEAGSVIVPSTTAAGSGGTGWNNRWVGGNLTTVVTSNGNLTFTAGDGSVYGGGTGMSLSGATSQTAAIRTFLATEDTGGADLYFSYAFRVTDGAATGDISAGMFVSVGALDAAMNTATDNFALITNRQLAARTNSTNAAVATTLQYNTAYLAVAKLGGWDGDSYTTTTVWLNPTSADENNTSLSAVSTNALGGASGFRGVVFRTSTIGTNVIEFDDLRVGTTWDDVVLSSVPEPSSAALLSGFFAAALVVASRRKREV